MHVGYSDVAIRHAIESDLCIKQHCITGLARTRKYNALCKIYKFVCMFTSPHECGLYAHTI